MARKKQQQKTAECKWCGTHGPLMKGHLIPKLWGKEGRQGEKNFPAYGPHGPEVVQTGWTDYMLCRKCEQTFGTAERDVSLNWRHMQKTMETLTHAGTWEGIKPGDPETPRHGAMGIRITRWTEVSAGVWGKVAAITAWRSAAWRHAGQEISQEEGWLRQLVEKQMQNDDETEAPLQFAWITGSLAGIGPADPRVTSLESPSHMTRGGDITTAHGGFSLVIGKGTKTGIARTLDIQPDGTWLVLEQDWTKGEMRKQLEKLLEKLPQRPGKRRQAKH